MPTASSSETPALRSMASLRELFAGLGDGVDLAEISSMSLELHPDMEDPPRLINCAPLEGEVLSRHLVGEPVAAFRAFLDGKQKSTYLCFAGGVPVIVGTVGAAVRARNGNHTETWRVFSERKLYAPYSGLAPWLSADDLERRGVVDTDEHSPGEDAGLSSVHPLSFARRAYHMVQGARERLEQLLAAQWQEERSEPLLVDGGISRVPGLSMESPLVGLVKSHRTMYVGGDDLPAVLALEAGERSSSFRIGTRGSSPVASWYLRLRRERGRDPLWGLVRLEVQDTAFTSGRADELSRWVLAETAPISLPDTRWDRLLYGVRDCEMFLSAVL